MGGGNDANQHDASDATGSSDPAVVLAPDGTAASPSSAAGAAGMSTSNEYDVGATMERSASASDSRRSFAAASATGGAEMEVVAEDGAGGAQLGVGANTDWRETTDESSGKPYYYHIVTNEVTWDKPPCLAALDDLTSSLASTKPVKGITKVGKKWRAQISVVDKRKSIGHFDSPEEASAVYWFIREALDGCGLPSTDNGRHAVYEAAKAKAIETSTCTLEASKSSVMEEKNADVSITKSRASTKKDTTGRSVSEWREGTDEASGSPVPSLAGAVINAAQMQVRSVPSRSYCSCIDYSFICPYRGMHSRRI